MVAGIHTFLITLTLQAVHMLPRRVRAALDARSRQVARERALRRQCAARQKG
jgi:hypothetical protein